MSCWPAVPRDYRWRRLVVLVADSHVIGALKRDLGAQLEVEITAPMLEFQIAVTPHSNAEVRETLPFAQTPRLIVAGSVDTQR